MIDERVRVGRVVIPMRITARWIVERVPGMTWEELQGVKGEMHRRRWDGVERGTWTDFAAVLEALRTSRPESRDPAE